MRNLIPSLFIITLLVAATPVAAQETPAGPPVLKTAISEVTVYSDRARVTREAKVNLHRSPTAWAITKLPGWVDDGSVRVSLSPRSTDKAYLEAEAAVQEITDQMAVLDDEERILQAEAQQIMAIKVFSWRRSPRTRPCGTSRSRPTARW